jgi:hypothetical protein
MAFNGGRLEYLRSAYISDYWTVGSHSIATTEKLQNPKVPNVALGVPIEYSCASFFPVSCLHPAHRLSRLRGWYVRVYESVILY